ncbi:hypothetical protein ACMYUL_00230 [Neisseria sp. CP9]|uniref:hypothetical protein n=1 Tax=Neisseria sp. CP9 TaxID=3388843 RepID=UPI0039EFC6B6
MMKTKKWNWIPTIKINELYFDKIYLDYKKILDELNANIFSENEDIYDSFIFEENGIKSLIYFEKNSQFAGMEIKNNLFYKDINLISKDIEEIKKIFGYDSLVLDKYDSVDCDDIRAIFWFENNKVESVTVF